MRLGLNMKRVLGGGGAEGDSGSGEERWGREDDEEGRKGQREGCREGI